MADVWGMFDDPKMLVWFILAGALAGVLATLGVRWYRLRVVQIEANLKRLMIERGMSAEEIDRVLQASAQPGEELPPRFTGSLEDDTATLVKMLTEYDYEGPDIERFVTEFRTLPAGIGPEARRELVRTRGLAAKALIENQREGAEIIQVVRAIQMPALSPSGNVERNLR